MFKIVKKLKKLSKRSLILIILAAIFIAGGIWIALAANNRGNEPVGWWKFDEGYGNTAYDAAGSNNGDLTGHAPTWKNEPDCRFGKCLYFDGSDDYVDIGGMGGTIKTIEFWMRTSSSTQKVLDIDGTDYIQLSSSSIQAVSFPGTTTYYVNGISKQAITLNQWMHVVITDTTGVSPTDMDIGAYDIGGSPSYFTGYLDEVRVYDYVRSAAQIKADYLTAGAGRGGGVRVGPVQDASEGLIAYYKFDEKSLNACGTNQDACDDSGGGNHLSAIADAAPTSTAKYGYAATFDGTGDYYCSDPDDDGDCDDDDDLDMGTSDFTIEAWVKTNNTDYNANFIRKWGATNGYWLGQSQIGDGEWYYLIEFDDTTVQDASITPNPTSEWTHLALVADRDGDAALYINGVLASDSVQDISAYSGVDISNSSQLFIGGYASWYVDGQIDDVKIYKTARSAGQIRRDYETGPPPVAHWKFDEKSGDTAYDSTGSNDGDLFGSCPGAATCPTWTDGKFGSALSFDGSNDYADVGDKIFTSGGEITTDDVTIMTWVKASSSDVNRPIGKLESSNDYVFIDVQTDQLLLHAKVGGTDVLKVGDWNVGADSGQWTHVAMVAPRGGTPALYKNGVSQAIGWSTSNTGDISNTGSLHLGRRDAASYFTGQLDDVRIYNYALTPKQVIQAMNADHPLVAGSPVGSYVAYWPFDEGYGTTVYDKSSASRNLTLSTASAFTNEGKFNGAYDGGDNRRAADGADDDDLDFTAGDDFSLSAWFKRDTISNNEYIIYKEDGNEGYTLYMDSSGDIIFGIGDTGSTSFPEESIGNNGTNYDDNSWHHALAVKTATSSLRLYVDGLEIASDTSVAVNASLANAGILYIGDANNTNGTDEFLGDIDEVSIYRFALSPTEIKQLYNQGATLALGSMSTESDGTSASWAGSREYCVPGDTSTCDPPVGHWKLDEKAGDTGYDSSAKTNDGDLAGSGGACPGAAACPTWKSATHCHSGACLDFDGSNDLVDMGNPADGSLDFGTGDFSIAFWVKTTNADINSQFDVWKWDYADGFRIGQAATGAGTWYWLIEFDNTEVQDNAMTPAPVVGQWTHLTLVADRNANASMYVNGVLSADSVQSIAAHSAANIDNAASFKIQPGVSAMIDDVRVYKYVRTPGQIAWEYNRGRPIGHWKMDEGQDSATTCDATGTDVYDYEGSYDGTLELGSLGNVTAANAWSVGKYSCGLDFDGSDDYVDTSYTTAIGTNDWAMAAWLKAPDSNQAGIAVSKRQTSSPFSQFCFGIAGAALFGTAGQLPAAIDYSSGGRDLLGSTDIADNSWHHLALVRTTANTKLYVDGVVEDTDSSTIKNLTNTDPVRLGDGNGTFRFKGLIDDVRIYNYAPTGAQIKDIYNQGAAVRFGPNQGLP